MCSKARQKIAAPQKKKAEMKTVLLSKTCRELFGGERTAV